MIHHTYGHFGLGIVNYLILSVRVDIFSCICAKFASVGGLVTLRFPRYPSMDSVIIDCSKASVNVAIHCCVKEIYVRASNPCIYHSL
jgi:hypothetical protein